jgi:hypothetical protein
LKEKIGLVLLYNQNSLENMLVENNAIRNGLLNLLNGKAPQQPSYGWIGWLLLALAAADLLNHLRLFWQVPAWADKTRSQNRLWLWVKVLVGILVPLAIIFGSNFFEVQKYLSLTNHFWSSATLVMARSVWDRVSPADQAVVQKAAVTWRDKQRKMVQESSEDFLAKLKAKGMQVNTPNNSLFVKAVAPVWKQYEDVFGKDFFELIEKARK